MDFVSDSIEYRFEICKRTPARISLQKEQLYKKSAKKVLALVLSCFLLLSLAACGGGNGGSGSNGGGDSGAAAPSGASGSSDAARSDASGDKLVLRLGHVVADESSLDQGMDALADLIKERSNGAIEVELYPNSTLGDNTALAEQLQFGSLEMAVPSIAAVSGFSRATAIFDMPFLFKNNAAAEEALDGELGDYVAAALEESGFHVGHRGTGTVPRLYG